MIYLSNLFEIDSFDLFAPLQTGKISEYQYFVGSRSMPFLTSQVPGPLCKTLKHILKFNLGYLGFMHVFKSFVTEL